MSRRRGAAHARALERAVVVWVQGRRPALAGVLALMAAAAAVTSCGGSEAGQGVAGDLRAARVTGIDLTGDESDDGVLNPGETAYLQITLRNEGQLALGPFDGQVTSTSEWVRFRQSYDSISYSRIDPGEERTSGSHALRVELSPETPAGTVIPFACTLIDGDDELLPITFSVLVRGPAGHMVIDSVTVESDNNRDGELNLGETAILRVAVRNAGTSRVTSTECTVSSESPHVEVRSSYDTLSYSSCDPGEVRISSSSALRVDVLQTATDGLELPFDCTLRDAQQAPFSVPFVVPVYRTSARLEERGVEVLSDDDGDGQLEVGESAYLRLSVQNTGAAQVSSSAGTVTSTADEVEFVQSHDTATFGDCGPGDTVVSSSHGLRLRANERPAAGTAELQVTLTDAEGNEFPLSFDLTVGP